MPPCFGDDCVDLLVKFVAATQFRKSNGSNSGTRYCAILRFSDAAPGSNSIPLRHSALSAGRAGSLMMAVSGTTNPVQDLCYVNCLNG